MPSPLRALVLGAAWTVSWIPAMELAAQADPPVEALAAAVDLALESHGMADLPRSSILLDTLQVGLDGPDALALARLLGLEPGRSEDHCRRFLLEPGEPGVGSPFGYQVQGVEGIVTISTLEVPLDSMEIVVRVARGAGRYVGMGGSYIVRSTASGWAAARHVTWSPHGSCSPRLFAAPLALAAQTALDDLAAPDPICLDPTGFPLHEQDEVAAMLGAQVEGQWMPQVRGETPDDFRDPCERSGGAWGSVIRFTRVEWESDDLLRVAVEGRIPARGIRSSVTRTLVREGGDWRVRAP